MVPLLLLYEVSIAARRASAGRARRRSAPRLARRGRSTDCATSLPRPMIFDLRRQAPARRPGRLRRARGHLLHQLRRLRHRQRRHAATSSTRSGSAAAQRQLDDPRTSSRSRTPSETLETDPDERERAARPVRIALHRRQQTSVDGEPADRAVDRDQRGVDEPTSSSRSRPGSVYLEPKPKSPRLRRRRARRRGLPLPARCADGAAEAQAIVAEAQAERRHTPSLAYYLYAAASSSRVTRPAKARLEAADQSQRAAIRSNWTPLAEQAQKQKEQQPSRRAGPAGRRRGGPAAAREPARRPRRRRSPALRAAPAP